MKLFKRLQALSLAIVMAIMTMGTTTAFAAEPTTENAAWVDAKDIEVTATYKTTIIADDTFNISGSHTGSTRTYNYNNMGFNFYFYDQNGNPLPNGSTILAVRRYDDTNGDVKEWQSSNGSIICGLSPISYGHRYHFQYLVAYGTPNVRIRMQIYVSN